MNTESFRGLRAKMPIIEDGLFENLEEIAELINIELKPQMFTGVYVCTE